MVLSKDLTDLIESGALLQGVWETIYITLLSTFIAYIIGLPLGILLHSTSKQGIFPIAWLNKILGFIINILRSIPFAILMVAIIPFAKFIVGISFGNSALIVTLVVAAFPYVARMVESSIKEINHGVIEAAQSMGTSNFDLILKVIIPEAKPSLITGAIISTVTVLGYSALASTIGAGGLGAIAIIYGYQRYNYEIIWICVIITVIIVQIIQEFGMAYVKKTDKRIKNK